MQQRHSVEGRSIDHAGQTIFEELQNIVGIETSNSLPKLLSDAALQPLHIVETHHNGLPAGPK